MTILVSGANGFVGSAMCSRLADREIPYRAAMRIPDVEQMHLDSVMIGSVDGRTDWNDALRGVRAVVHLAARVHVMRESSNVPLAEFRRVNVHGTENLARQAAHAGVKRFVYASSVKVNGEATTTGRPFRADDVPAPEDPYGISKFEAEQVLRRVSIETGMEVVIVRPPLIYGPQVRGNFEVMMRWLARGVPLPFAGTSENRRSLIGLDNFVDFLERCIYHPGAANRTFLVSDGQDLSTAELLTRLAIAMGAKSRLFRLPDGFLRFGLQIMGKGDVYRRLCGSLQVDIQKTKYMLDWYPPISVDEGMRQVSSNFRS
jgi:nucleoside-diphosphate-sugar epimerase